MVSKAPPQGSAQTQTAGTTPQKTPKKYVLAKGDDASRKACAFFGTVRGCKNGDACRFLHEGETSAAPVSQPSPSKKTNHQPPSPTADSTPQPPKKRPRGSPTPAAAPHTETPSVSDAVQTSSDDSRGTAEWQPLVKRTQEHPKFAFEYAFPAADSEAGVGWMQTKPCGDWCFGLPHVLAIDCEMCVVKNTRESFFFFFFSSSSPLGRFLLRYAAQTLSCYLVHRDWSRRSASADQSHGRGWG